MKLVRDEEQVKTAIAYSQLPKFIEEIERRVKEIPEDQVVALSVIRALLELMNSYGLWVEGMKKEIIKLENLNKAQKEMIHNLKPVVIT